MNWPTPTNVTELRSFLGLASYYRRFICRFAEVAAPLHRLHEKAISFQWSEQCNSAFETLKRRLSSAPVLAFPRSSDTFILDPRCVRADTIFTAIGFYRHADDDDW